MGERNITVGIVGGGRVGAGFIANLQREQGISVTAVVTATAKRQQELAEKFGITAFGTTEEMLASNNKPAVVCVVNANGQHASPTIQALDAGCHVYLEKPMAPTLEECTAIVEAARGARGHLQVGFEYIHGTMTSRLKELLADGYFGEPLWASVVDSRGHWWSDGPNVSRDSIWKLDRKRGGGIIFHCGIHQLDVIRTYLGPIDEVCAYCPPRNPLQFYPDDVPANVTLMLKAHSGAVCNFQVFHDRAVTYYRRPNYSPDYLKAPGHEFNVSLIGTKASCYMRIYDEVLHLMKLDHETKENRFDRTEIFGPNHPDLSHHDMLGLLLRFIRSVGNGGPAIDSAEDALETMRLAFASEDAIAKRGTVYLKDYR